MPTMPISIQTWPNKKLMKEVINSVQNQKINNLSLLAEVLILKGENALKSYTYLMM